MVHHVQEPGIKTQSDNTNDDNFYLGSIFIILNNIRRTDGVYPYEISIKAVYNVPVVSAKTAHDDPITGTININIMNEGPYYGERLDHMLVNPNQFINDKIEF